jgi:hypothetical protein
MHIAGNMFGNIYKMNEVKVIEYRICYTEPNILSSHEDQATGQPDSFENMLDSRRNEACRSILVQVQSEQSCCDLHKYCNQYGEVKGMHHYSLPGSLVCTGCSISIILPIVLFTFFTLEIHDQGSV